MSEIQYHRLFGTQERIDLKLLMELYDKFKGDIFINANIRCRIENLTKPRPLVTHEQPNLREDKQ